MQESRPIAQTDRAVQAVCLSRGGSLFYPPPICVAINLRREAARFHDLIPFLLSSLSLSLLSRHKNSGTQQLDAIRSCVAAGPASPHLAREI